MTIRRDLKHGGTLKNPFDAQDPSRAEPRIRFSCQCIRACQEASAFFQEGLENNTEKGRRTVKVLQDRESIRFYRLCLRTKQFKRWGALYQLFSCKILRSTSVSELIAKLYKVLEIIPWSGYWIGWKKFLRSFPEEQIIVTQEMSKVDDTAVPANRILTL